MQGPVKPYTRQRVSSRLYYRATDADKLASQEAVAASQTSLRSSAEPNRMYREDEFNDSNRTSRLLQAER